MTINIFAVGRSGTTVAELYIAYLLAKKYGSVYINNEPFTWLNRKGGANYYGQDIYIKNRFFDSDRDHSSLDNYVSTLVSEVPTVNKFIKGNGFVDKINSLTKADHSLLLIRDIYQVLSSLNTQRNWDYFTYNDSRILLKNKKAFNYWDQYFEEIKDTEIIKSLPFEVTKDSPLLLRNAIHWYFMNYKALTAKSEMYILKYDEIEKIEKDFPALLDIKAEKIPGLRSSFFRDRQINSDTILKTPNDRQTILKFPISINKLFFRLNMKFGWNIPYIKLPVGTNSLLSITNDEIESKPFVSSSKKQPIQRTKELDYLNDTIMELLEKSRKCSKQVAP